MVSTASVMPWRADSRVGHMLLIKGMRFPKEIILVSVRWYTALHGVRAELSQP